MIVYNYCLLARRQPGHSKQRGRTGWSVPAYGGFVIQLSWIK